MMRLFSHILLCSILIVLSSCSSTTSKSEYTTFNQQLESISKSKNNIKLISDFDEIPKHKNLDNMMAPGFEFWLSHPSDEKLKGKFRVDFDGILRLPYSIRIQVKGLTFNELREKVYSSYAKFFQKGVADVEFKLLYRDYYVEVRGFVKKSGRYLISRNESIDKVIDKAGGVKGDLKESFFKATIKQHNTSYAVSLNQYFENSFNSNVFTWTGGDTIFITEQDESEMGNMIPIVTVLGGVNNPGKILFKENANLFYYLGKSGGTIPNLSYQQSYIIRNTATGVKKIQFDITDMDAIPAIEYNDTILLQGNSITATDRVLNRTAQITSIITTLLLIVLAL